MTSEKIQRVGVIGAGIMGAGIARCAPAHMSMFWSSSRLASLQQPGVHASCVRSTAA